MVNMDRRVSENLLLAYITLILKKEKLENAGDFGPIILFNVLLKIISKVDMNRM